MLTALLSSQNWESLGFASLSQNCLTSPAYVLGFGRGWWVVLLFLFLREDPHKSQEGLAFSV